MQIRQRNIFTTIRSEGSILPGDLLERINNRDAELKGLRPEDYHLAGRLKLNEAINQSWNRLQGAWSNFRDALRRLPENDPATTLTREKWLLPLFHELGYGRLLTAKAIEIEGKSYPISHLWQHTPVHLVGAKVDLDVRPSGVAGAARRSPHSLLQELLNRTDDHLWGFVSNGLRLRILRDNISLTRQSYVEFDLEAMMEGEVYPDFVLCWLLCHESRLEAERPTDCWLEKWSKAAHDQGTRALDELRNGVEEAIRALGRGFLDHRHNRQLRSRLQSGELDKQDYYRQLLRLVYRLLFLFVAEDRELLFAPSADERVRERYTRFYSVSRLRRLAERRLGTRHSDLYHGLRLVMQKLGHGGCSELGLPALGSFLFSNEAIADLEGCEIANHDLRSAIRALAFITDGHGRRTVDYKNLRSEELGSVYEALLELHPVINAEARQFDLERAGGNERKTTGSYYTPDSLVQCLLDSALDPVVAEARQQPDPEAALLRLKVVDPACGSGHFLIAAAHRLSKHLAAVRTGDDEPAPEAMRTALRDVIGRCIYGVDLNPMAVELCKVSLWMEALEPGKPLSFLDHRIQWGNSLIGATPALMKNGIPDEAFKPIEGDDKAICNEYRKQNRLERKDRKRPLIDESIKLGNLAASIAELDAIDDSDIAGVRAKQQGYEMLVKSSGYLYGQFLADAWCAAFVWKKTREFPYPITEAVFREIEQNPYRHATGHEGGWLEREVKRLAAQYQFFHWHLAFPDVFHVRSSAFRRSDSEQVDTGEALPPEGGTTNAAGWTGGFDVVLGNPPWERIKLQEKEWFAERQPEIANAPNAAARQRMIRELTETDPALLDAFLDDRRKAEGESHFVRSSGRYPLCGRGDINTYAIFAETNRMLLSQIGRAGFIIQSDIATGDTYQDFFSSLLEREQLVSFYDFVNTEGLFPHIHRTHPHFCLITLSGSPTGKPADFAFWNTNTGNLEDEQRHFQLAASDFALLNPNTQTCPIFRNQRDAELTKAIYRRVPVLIAEGQPDGNPWGIRFATLFHMANDSGLFRTREQLAGEGWRLAGNAFVRSSAFRRAVERDEEQNPPEGGTTNEYLPLYEAKMIYQFNHRHGDYSLLPEGERGHVLPDIPLDYLRNPNYVVQPRYWVPRDEVIYKITRVPVEVLKAYRAGEEEDLMDAVSGWLAAYELAKMTDDELHKRASTTKQRQQVREQREAARQVMAEYPLSEDEALDLRHSRDLRCDVAELIEAKAPRWLLGWRDVTDARASARTVIASVLPRVGVGHKFPLMSSSLVTTIDLTCLYANLTCFAFDYIARQKIGGTSLTYFYLKQFPVLPPSVYATPCPWSPSETLREWLVPRVLELSYTAYDLRGFAEDCGYAGGPFRWDEARRFLLRCELDAAYFHLYGIMREDVAYILDTFPIVKRKDEAQHGEYRTRRVILEIYDAMAAAMKGGREWGVGSGE
jgi:hypothetical protein